VNLRALRVSVVKFFYHGGTKPVQRNTEAARRNPFLVLVPGLDDIDRVG
jgi:hypothetical protein